MASAQLENLECPICLETPEKEIYQCENGHTFCANCEQHLSICPQCKVSLGQPKIRCRALEDLLDQMKFICDFTEAGCTTKVARNEISNHRETCEFSPNKNSICNALGYKCGHVVSLQDLSKTIQHLKKKHDFIVCQASHLEIQLEGLNPNMSWGSSMWTPIVVDKLQTDNQMLVILCLINGKDDPMLSFVCLRISGQQDDRCNSFQTNFRILGTNSKNPDIKWSMEPVNVEFGRVLIKQPFFRTPLKLLQEGYISDTETALSVMLWITKTGDHTNQTPETLIIFNRTQNAGTGSDLHMISNITSFSSVRCDCCQKKPITSRRYKCLQCYNFDLCKACIDNGNHEHHVFIVLNTLEQDQSFKEQCARALNDSTSWIQKSDITALGLLPGPEEQCANCVRRKKYVCMNCKTLKGFCTTCFETSSHSANHLFVYAYKMPQLKSVIAALRDTGYCLDNVIQYFALTYIKM